MTIDHLIFVTTDGLRWDEFFSGSPSQKAGCEVLMSSIWNPIDQGKLVFGLQDDERDIMRASHPSFVSLPSYQTMTTGTVVEGHSNSLQAVTDTIWSALAKQQKTGAVFASWKKIAMAVGETGDSCFKSIGPQQDDQTVPTWEDCRWDEHTYSDAVKFLKVDKPNYLWMSLAETDDIAHEQNFDRYIESVTHFDFYMQELEATIQESFSGRTVLFVTTDHGRGAGDGWHDHSADLPHSENIWAYLKGFGCGLRKASTGPYSQLNIRPTILELFGLQEAQNSKFQSLVTLRD